MNEPVIVSNEDRAAMAFSKQAPLFDGLYGNDAIIQYKRQCVRQHVMKYLKPGSSMLELNAGTGEDALFFAAQGCSVHATDISATMLEALQTKREESSYKHRISTEQISYTALSSLQNKGPYDYLFSNFAGLNCTGELSQVLSSFADLLNPGGMVTLVVMPPFCLWELLLMVKGKFRTATRRFFSRKGINAKVEGVPFRCWYYPPSAITRALQKEFSLVDIQGLCTLVPPSYLVGFAEKYPRLFSRLCKTEGKRSRRWPWKYIGDYYIISLRKK